MEAPNSSRQVRPGRQSREPGMEELHMLLGLQGEQGTLSLMEKHHAEVLKRFELQEEILQKVGGEVL